MFDRHKRDLMSDLRGMPRNTTIRKINDMIQRTKEVKVHAHLVGYLFDETPKMFGKSKKMKKLKEDVPGVFFAVQKKYNFIQGDFPNIEQFEEKLAQFDDFRKDFCTLDENLLHAMEETIKTSLPRLLAQLPTIPRDDDDEGKASGNPFDDDYVSAGTWLVDKVKKEEYDTMYYQLRGADGSGVPGGECVAVFKAKSKGMSQKELHKVWDLADNKKKGKLDHEQFAVAMFLIEAALAGHPIPEKLPAALLPPSQRVWDDVMK